MKTLKTAIDTHRHTYAGSGLPIVHVCYASIESRQIKMRGIRCVYILRFYIVTGLVRRNAMSWNSPVSSLTFGRRSFILHFMHRCCQGL